MFLMHRRACHRTAEGVSSETKQKKIDCNVVMCSPSLNMMISDFQKHIEVKSLKFDDEEVVTRCIRQQLIDTEMTLKRSDP